jgi:hypothetical protein
MSGESCQGIDWMTIGQEGRRACAEEWPEPLKSLKSAHKTNFLHAALERVEQGLLEGGFQD